MPFGIARAVIITEKTGDLLSFGTIQTAVVGNSLTTTKTLTGLTGQSAGKALAIVQFCIPFNWSEDYAGLSLTYNGSAMTKLYWSRATISGAGKYPWGYTVFAYIDSPAASGDLVWDGPASTNVYTVAATWIPIFGAAAGSGAFGATARAENTDGSTPQPLQITPTQSNSWLFAAMTRRDNTDRPFSWDNGSMIEMLDAAGSGALDSGCWASARRQSADTNPHDVGGDATNTAAASDYRGTVAAIELLQP